MEAQRCEAAAALGHFRLKVHLSRNKGEGKQGSQAKTKSCRELGVAHDLHKDVSPGPHRLAPEHFLGLWAAKLQTFP